MTNPVKILFIGLSIALAAYVYKVNVDRFSPPDRTQTKPLFEAKFKTVLSMARNMQGLFEINGRCLLYSTNFKYYPDSVIMQLPEQPKLMYRVLGIDENQGLHVFKTDSTQLVFYKVEDPRPQYRALGDTCVLMVDDLHQRAFLLCTSSKCE